MDPDAYVDHIRTSATKLSACATQAGLDTDVPTCPGWSIEDLVAHTGRVHRHKTETIRGGWIDASPPFPDPPNRDVIAWFDAGVTEMLEVFGMADLEAPTCTWCPHEHTAAWWVRRMAHETVIHAADAIATVGEAPTVEPALALDGVDELLDEMLVGGPTWSTVRPTDQVIALEAGDRRWVLRTAVMSGTSPATGRSYEDLDVLVHDGSAEPNAVVSTDPGTLDLWLWGRANLPDQAISGDPALVRHLRTLAAEATQ